MSPHCASCTCSDEADRQLQELLDGFDDRDAHLSVVGHDGVEVDGNRSRCASYIRQAWDHDTRNGNEPRELWIREFDGSER